MNTFGYLGGKDSPRPTLGGLAFRGCTDTGPNAFGFPCQCFPACGECGCYSHPPLPPTKPQHTTTIFPSNPAIVLRAQTIDLLPAVDRLQWWEKKNSGSPETRRAHVKRHVTPVVWFSSLQPCRNAGAKLISLWGFAVQN